VHRAANGKLAYKPDARGNTIPDFSRAGYGGGGIKLPDIPVVVRLSPREFRPSFKVPRKPFSLLSRDWVYCSWLQFS
jgi:hypothetical protein